MNNIYTRQNEADVTRTTNYNTAQVEQSELCDFLNKREQRVLVMEKQQQMADQAQFLFNKGNHNFELIFLQGILFKYHISQL